MSIPVKHILIIGGGSAGWLTAGIIAAEHNSSSKNGLKVTLIESPDIPTIGVGEGTWPTMRTTLQSIGLSEAQFIDCCDASFKQGSQFIGWCNGQENDHYYHPFMAPQGLGKVSMIDYWQQQSDMDFGHFVSMQPHICDQHLAPKQIQTPEYAAVANYGYHLDAGKFAKLLKQHCIEQLGVNYLSDNVTTIHNGMDDYIASVTTNKHGQISADLFVDCTGHQGLLIAQHYQIPWLEQKSVLFNDRALAVQVPYPNEHSPIASHTKSTAHDSGWIWDIGLPSRRGIGCVYASDYCPDETAEKALRNYLLQTLSASDVDKLSFRKLTFNPGYREKFWHKNCIAIGMSSGFIEPLEASALALIELSAKILAKEMPANRAIMSISEQRYNQRFEYRWQRIIEFLKLHYVLSTRTSPFWQDNRKAETIPKRLQQLLALWQYQEPSFNDFSEIEEIFPAASYQYVLYGMHFTTQPRPTKRRLDDVGLCQHYAMERQQLTHKFLSGLPSNRDLLNQIKNQFNKNNKVQSF